MGVFDDKRYESLDWVSQAVEPIESPLTALLSSIPDEVSINFDLFSELREGSYNRTINKETVIHHLLKSLLKEGQTISWDDQKLISTCFRFEVANSTIIDVESGLVDGSIKLIKIKSNLEEDELKSILGRDGISALGSVRHYEMAPARVNELLEMIGKCDDAVKSRSIKTKIRSLRCRLQEIMKTNEWNIKDTNLANKVGQWMADYLNDGNLAALGNFAKLKVMTHRGLPIYSMEEIK